MKTAKTYDYRKLKKSEKTDSNIETNWICTEEAYERIKEEGFRYETFIFFQYIHTIIENQLNDYQSDSNQDFVTIDNPTFNRWIDRIIVDGEERYDSYFTDKLQEFGIILIKKVYEFEESQKGKKTKCKKSHEYEYRFSPSYQTTNFVRVSIRDRKIANKVKSFLVHQKKNCLKPPHEVRNLRMENKKRVKEGKAKKPELLDCPERQYLYDCLSQFKLSDGYIAKIDEILSSYEGEERDNRLEGIQLNAQRIQSNEHYCRSKSLLSRMHTPNTSLKRECRRFLTWNGEPCVELDFRCFQPLLASFFYKDKNSEEYESYIETCFSKRFYKVLCELAALVFGYKPPLKMDGSRDYVRIKEQVLSVYFCEKLEDGRWKCDPKLREMLSTTFEDLFKVLDEVRTPNHRELARRLQAAEVMITIYTIVPQLRKLGIPCLLIYDAFVVPEQHCNRTFEIMNSVLSEKLNRDCADMIKITHYNRIKEKVAA